MSNARNARMTSMNTIVDDLVILQSIRTAPIVKRYGFVLPGAGINIVKSLITKVTTVVATFKLLAQGK